MLRRLFAILTGKDTHADFAKIAVEDRRAMAGVLLGEARLGSEVVNLLSATERAAESVVRAFDAASPAMLILPSLAP